jgi:hypothetical protein
MTRALFQINRKLSSISMLGLSIFGSVRFWTKINNQTDFIFFSFGTELNQKPVQTN